MSLNEKKLKVNENIWFLHVIHILTFFSFFNFIEDGIGLGDGESRREELWA